ncbi:S-adenosylmethionine:tRNA ribosyltransferase-isomerase [Campylobacter lari]|uniref:tRNA preQ1(34) S-adenosylmethionine ribosyltransferase-isomerase QueA n=1 Tax=Campylobacter lari TaxID=201 RepID=UPI000B4045E3|nr:tRNA preQ1(34) S-adenosylmethionine ribosyltransferase-isomerase QueA [Campylobacter lari]MBT0826859.1 tRNA preQ1(34) S-adenosylmethionine ribosyltransferase-isomerase QueA [Campylobacter lari]MCR6529362.1 tRNA preQ1(34) S-adenosylmethionine ribosyltransferase-isomerase QueA [Campylobacter lari]
MKMIDKDLLLSSYDYNLPNELIANFPILPKENAKLLVYERCKDQISHLHFKDLARILPPCEIIFNDTKVIKARIYGNKESGSKIELFINHPLKNNDFLVQIRGKIKEGQILYFENSLKAKIKKLHDDGTREVEFFNDEKELNHHEVFEILEKIGHVPLPPYIKRADEAQDSINYQSIFAKNQGAVAAPTASLHFDEAMINELKKNHNIHTITLHVGAGTFKGVECEDIRKHKMHSEFFHIDDETCALIDSSKKILGVGTTVTRCIEYYHRKKIKEGFCDLFLHPQNIPQRLDYLLTNFHLPKSTLIMLVAAFIGREKTLELYHEAIENNYRFYSYGDGMLII